MKMVFTYIISFQLHYSQLMYKFEFMACLLKVTSQHGNLHTHTPPFATKTHTHPQTIKLFIR